MQPLEITSFIEKYAAGTYTEAEHQEFKNWLISAPLTEIDEILNDYSNFSKPFSSPSSLHPNLAASIEATIDQYELGNNITVRKTKVIYWSGSFQLVAAIFIGVAVIAGWLITNTNSQDKRIQPSLLKIKNEVAPGRNKAVLTLADGSVIALDDEKNGHIAKQGNVEVNKSNGAQLEYKLTGSNKPSEIEFNTLSTPRGGQYKLNLPDGSHVWLNAASSIKYPTAFTGNERKVEISGEVYFEIAHDARMPFKVSVNGMEVKVLGTHFNVNAYSDEMAVKTSLLEGSIELSKSGNIISLKPGQQAQLVTSSGIIRVLDDIDMDEVVAWKNGYFSFNKADLQTVMRQIARWYDVEIFYEGKIPQRFFGGKIDRKSNASEVLKILEESKVHFSIENKKIIVKP